MDARDGLSDGAIFAAAPDPIVVVDHEGLIRGWNPAAEQAFGYAAEAVVGKVAADVLIPDGFRAGHHQARERYLATGEHPLLGRRVEADAIHAAGHQIPVELVVTRLAGSDPPVFAVFLRDLTVRRAALAARDRLEHRLAFLAEAGAVLDWSLNLGETLERLSQLPVPELCDLCIIDVLQPGGLITSVGVAATDPEWADELRIVREQTPLDPAGPHPVAEVLRTGRSALIPELSTPFLREIAGGDEHRRLMERLAYRSAIVTPLFARGRVLGALSMLRIAERARYDADDLTLAEELARRAAIAVDNARVFETTHHVAVTLQQSLLPRSLPLIPRIRLDARYRAAGEAQQVGGDFYDAFALPDGSHALVIGDVCGKGPEAAALTALARYTIRGSCNSESDPAAVLSVLNDTIAREVAGSGRFLTAVLAVLRADGERMSLQVACAGHPSPVIARAGAGAEVVAASGGLIGVHPDLGLRVARTWLGAGDTLVLYTDGITDAGAPEHTLGDSDLQAIVAAAAAQGAEGIADALEQGALAYGAPRDDIALLLAECER